MDLIRLVSKDGVTVYVRSDSIFMLGKMSETVTNVGVVLPGIRGVDIEVEMDVDELAASLERNVPGVHIRYI